MWQHFSLGGGFVEEQEHAPDYRTVAVYWTRVDAELARGLLHSDGIPAAFVETSEAPLLPGLASSPVRLLVPAADLERSRELLCQPREPIAPVPTPVPIGPRAAGAGLALAAAVVVGLGALAALVAAAL